MAIDKPPNFRWILYRKRQQNNQKPAPWNSGYTVYQDDGTIRMGRYVGDYNGETVVDPEEIEWTERR